MESGHDQAHHTGNPNPTHATASPEGKNSRTQHKANGTRPPKLAASRKARSNKLLLGARPTTDPEQEATTPHPPGQVRRAEAKQTRAKGRSTARARHENQAIAKVAVIVITRKSRGTP